MIKVTCDKCGKEIEYGFFYIRNDFYSVGTMREYDVVCLCANGDNLVFCEQCYVECALRERDE